MLEKMSAQRASGSRCLIFVYSDSWIVLLECTVKIFRKIKAAKLKQELHWLRAEYRTLQNPNSCYAILLGNKILNMDAEIKKLRT